MYTVSAKRQVYHKLISMVTASFFFLNIFITDVLAQPLVSTLAPLATSENPKVKREITASMYRASRLIWLANSPRYLDLLARYNALALLLPSGRYLMAPETAANDLLLIKSAIHEDNEILMQQEEKLHSTRYNRLMQQILGRDDIMKLYRALSHYKEPNKQPNNIIFNDLIAKAFEILSIIDENLVYPSELKPEEIEFIALMRPILQAKDSRNRYKNFSQVFFDTDKRTKAIKALQENKNERFYRVANANSSFANGNITKEVLSMLQERLANNNSNLQELLNVIQRHHIEFVEGKPPQEAIAIEQADEALLGGPAVAAVGYLVNQEGYVTGIDSVTIYLSVELRHPKAYYAILHELIEIQFIARMLNVIPTKYDKYQELLNYGYTDILTWLAMVRQANAFKLTYDEHFEAAYAATMVYIFPLLMLRDYHSKIDYMLSALGNSELREELAAIVSGFRAIVLRAEAQRKFGEFLTKFIRDYKGDTSQFSDNDKETVLGWTNEFFTSSRLPLFDIFPEDHAVEGNVAREDVEVIAKLADSSGAKCIILPADIIRELEDKFGQGKVGPVELVVVEQSLMHTRDQKPIGGPVRLGSRIFVGVNYFAEHNNDPRSILTDLGHEAMAQWIAERRPDLNADAHELAGQAEEIIRVGQRSQSFFDAEPQLKQDNSYGMALRRLLNGPAVTQESIKRRRILNKIGLEAERYVRTHYDNPNVKIIITPYGSTLKGYADEKSDLEYAIYIVSGAEKEPALDRSPRRIRIHEEINNLINGQQEGVKAEDMIGVLPIMNLSGFPSGDVRGSLLGGELDAWYLMHLFLPMEYGDGSLIEQRRKNIITYFSEKGQEGQDAWKSIQRVYAEYVAIREGDVNLKSHLRSWLARQNVTSLEDFNKARAVGLPDLDEMISIYGVLGAVNHRGVPSPHKLSLDEKIRIVSQKHNDSYSAIQREHNLDPFIYSISDPEGAKDIISWLCENGYLDSSKKFCDPFMGNGLLVHLAHVMTGADSTGYEKDPRIHQEAVRISTGLSELGVVDPERIHFVRGDSSSISLKQYDVFYLLPPWEDGIPDPMLTWNVITNMKPGAIMVLTIGIDPSSIYYRPPHLENYIEKIADIRGGVVYRRISRLSGAASPTNSPDVGAVKQAFDTLSSEVKKASQLGSSISKLRGTSQNLMEVNKFRFCLPIEVLRNSPDIALALNSTGLLKQKSQDAENIEFELVVTGVTEEDVKLIEGLNRDDIKKALNLPEKFTVSIITEAQIQETAQRFGYDASNPKNRVAIIKDFFSGALAKGEYMAIATDAIDSTEKADLLKEELERELKAELSQENISIRVLVRPESGMSMYSLSKIINDWLEAINQGNFSTISRILPIPAPLTPELERAIRTAWAVLTAA